MTWLGVPSHTDIAAWREVIAASRSMRGLPIEARLWGRVAMSDRGCWVFLGAVLTTGYAVIAYDSRRTCRASRVAYTIAYRTIPPGMHIGHRCDNRACVNPEHLFAGTHTDNMQDMLAKGRSAAGMRNAKTRHPQTVIDRVRALVAGGSSQAEAARMTGLTKGYVSKLIRRVARVRGAA